MSLLIRIRTRRAIVEKLGKIIGNIKTSLSVIDCFSYRFWEAYNIFQLDNDLQKKLAWGGQMDVSHARHVALVVN